MSLSALIAGLFSGITAAMGLGGGAVLIIYLSVFSNIPQLKSQGINLLFFVPIAACAVAIYAFKKKISWKTVLPISAGAVAGAFLGIFAAGACGDGILSKLFGGGLAVLGVKEIIQCLKSKKKDDIIPKE